MTEREQRDDELKRIAAMTAAEVVRVAASAAEQVANTAANAANVLAESNRIDLGYIKADLREIKERLDSKFVSVESFNPVKNIVYGMVVCILLAVLGGLVQLVVHAERSAPTLERAIK